ncbi:MULTISPECIES: DMT family transporter [unclassified Janthinobacterium]|uniref:DMT family transporter n=1 Tax=unclassified Janthinobacterium TaxID=2610881 RepID=UPI001607EA8F|nr:MULTISPECIES: DMT family transporter [unclassified Janthinobacterium]MBB5371656.1 drug/metabolite transporter (DMT)-like permease [Janthinobacterium sp. K2C7]MBB5384461.1 drug/metabolite transporter (DMT)-like permease [Janthinobacterium sp. K2Li3]MBB5389737.1 drug/metabolite transporter (DMT)-like permease [Janthinobacterium sp. K2E3]
MPVRAYIYPFLAMLLWAGNVVVSKLAAASIAPTAITFYRLVLVLLVMTPFIIRPLWSNRAAICRQWWQLAVCGLMSMALFQSLSYRAADSTTATNMAIVTALAPLMTAILSVLLLGERLTVGMAAGGLLSFGGLLYLVGRGDVLALLHEGVHAGDGLMLLATLIFALYGVLLRRWRLSVPPWQMIYCQALAALLCMLPFFLLLPAGHAALDATTLPLIAYAGIGSSIVLSFLWIQGVKLLGPNRCSIYVNLLPILTALLAIVWLHESMRGYHLIGGGISLLGVLLAQTVQQPLFARRANVSGVQQSTF